MTYVDFTFVPFPEIIIVFLLAFELTYPCAPVYPAPILVVLGLLSGLGFPTDDPPDIYILFSSAFLEPTKVA
ncbi:hypothetical protein V2I21_08020 [Campylobacter sp. CLAX-22107-21]|uniref:hypothetical protein n=1 Tax=Campylobacter devanensis TaxID=3161138 RepID=UPI002EAF4CA7|nr:hypothetical protein [Campylobacter sp. CLAX-22107-21]